MAESLADKLIQLSPTQLKSVFDTLDLLIKNPNTIAYAMDDEEPEIENELNRQADEEKYDHEMLAEPPKKKRGRPKKKSEPEVVAQEEVKVTSSRYNSDIQPIVRNQVKTVNAEGKVAATELDIHIAKKLIGAPLLASEKGWALELYGEELNMTRSMEFFETRPTKYQLYEGGMIWHFDHLYAEPRYWVKESKLRKLATASAQEHKMPGMKRAKHRIDLSDFQHWTTLCLPNINVKPHRSPAYATDSYP